MDTAVAEPTTTATPETSSPAPSTSTSSAPVTSTTPTTASTPAAERLTPTASMKEISNFLRAADAPAAATPAPSLAAPQEGATIPPAAATPKGEVSTGPIPFEVHSKALENARTKAVDGFRTQYGITPQVTPETFQKGIGFARAIDANPIQFLNELSASIANHPTWGPQLRSSAGRTLAAAPAARPEPDVQVMNAQGQVVGMTYSAERQQAVNEWDWAQREAKFDQRLQPLVQAHEQQKNEAQQVAFQKQVDAGAEAEQARVNEILDGKTELGPKVAELMAQGVNHIDAAIQVRKQFIAPTITAAAEAAVLDTQRKKAAGNTVNGSGPTTTTRKIGPNSSQKEISAFLREQAEGASA